jgi:hypothetical protein
MEAIGMKAKKSTIVVLLLISIFLIISCGKNDGNDNDDGDVGDSGSTGTEAIAVWAFPDGVSIPYRDDNNDIVAGDSSIGVAAYHSTGIDQVAFTVNGLTTHVTTETVNPETNEYEYVLTLDPSTLPADGEYTITAVAHPNNGTATTLPNLIIQKDTASHNVLYVGGGGFATIDDACQAAEGGDIIKVRAGTYALPDQTGYNFEKYVTIMPDGSDVVEITSGSLRSSYIKFKDVTFNLTSSVTDSIISHQETHFWFDGCTAIGFDKDAANNNAAALRFYTASDYIVVEDSTFYDMSIGVQVLAGNSIVRNNHIYDLTADGIGYDGNNIFISNNLIHDNHLPVGGDQHCTFLACNTGAAMVVIRNNTMYNGDHQGIKFGAGLPVRKDFFNIAVVNNLIALGADGTVNIRFENTSRDIHFDNVLVEHNTVWDGTSMFIIESDPDANNMVVRNNIFGPKSVDDMSMFSQFDIDYNCYSSGTATGPNSVTGDPQFANSGNWNFVLNGSSPAKNRGNYFANIKYDINWNPRNLTNPSMGAYE